MPWTAPWTANLQLGPDTFRGRDSVDFFEDFGFFFFTAWPWLTSKAVPRQKCWFVWNWGYPQNSHSNDSNGENDHGMLGYPFSDKAICTMLTVVNIPSETQNPVRYWLGIHSGSRVCGQNLLLVDPTQHRTEGSIGALPLEPSSFFQELLAASSKRNPFSLEPGVSWVARNEGYPSPHFSRTNQPAHDM